MPVFEYVVERLCLLNHIDYLLLADTPVKILRDALGMPIDG
jgi:hypothetical protein